MAWYPFDTQTCRIEMVMDGVLDNYATLLPGGVNFTGPKELTQYYVQDFQIKMETISEKPGVVVSMTLGRRLLGTFLTIFFPTILLNVIGHKSCYKFFQGVTVNLTSMLVLTTMFINVSNNLPKTSDFLHEYGGCLAVV